MWFRKLAWGDGSQSVEGLGRQIAQERMGCGSCVHACMAGVAGLAHASAPFQSFVFLSLRCHLLYIEQALHLINEPIEIGKKLR